MTGKIFVWHKNFEMRAHGDGKLCDDFSEGAELNLYLFKNILSKF